MRLQRLFMVSSIVLALSAGVLATAASAGSGVSVSDHIRGPVKASCEAWNDFGSGDITAPVVGNFYVREISAAADGTLTLVVHLRAHGLTPGRIVVNQHEYYLSHGFDSCSADIVVASFVVSKKGILNNVAFKTTWTPSTNQMDDGPEWTFCTGVYTGRGHDGCFRTGPVNLTPPTS